MTRYKMGDSRSHMTNQEYSHIQTMSSAVPAGLPPKDGPRSGGATKPSAGLGSYSVHKADGQQRPNYGEAMINAADRRHDTDPAIRSAEKWI